MLRQYLTNKWVLSAIGFLIVLSVACVLWYQHDIAADRHKLTKAEERKRQQETSQKTDIVNAETNSNITTDSSTKTTSDKSITTETPLVNKTTKTISDLDNGKDIAAETTEPVRMSPFGLGPYPEIPTGWPDKGFVYNTSIEHELMERLQMKMFSDTGVIYPGARMDDSTGLIKLISKDVVYVEWGMTYINGIPKRYISGMSTHPETGNKIRSNAKARQSEVPDEFRIRRRPLLIKEDIPSGVKIKPYHGGIDPYEFLGLERR